MSGSGYNNSDSTDRKSALRNASGEREGKGYRKRLNKNSIVNLNFKTSAPTLSLNAWIATDSTLGRKKKAPNLLISSCIVQHADLGQILSANYREKASGRERQEWQEWEEWQAPLVKEDRWRNISGLLVGLLKILCMFLKNT